jgi:endonuclease/exonuclease/phosphatase (EEP) superfamily protein YafD
VGFLVCAATIAGFASQFGWLLELTSHFRVQYFFTLVIITIWLASLKKLAAATVCAVFAIVNLTLILPFYLPMGAMAQENSTPVLRALLLNVNARNQNHDRVIQEITANDPHILVLLEVTPTWANELESLQKSYPYRLIAPQQGNFGIALLSKLPWKTAAIVPFGAIDRPSVVAEFQVYDQLVTLVGTHPSPPMSPSKARQRNQQLQRIANFLRPKENPVLLVGDLNISPWSYYFGQLLKNANLRNSAYGWGVMPTWPAGFAVLWIPIDHFLVSEDITIHQRRNGSAVGSDHYPVIVDFSLNR